MSVADVAIIDCGGANIASLTNALDRLDVAWALTTDPNAITKASQVILPGVGAAADTMEKLSGLALDEVIVQLTQPVLGICLGLQLLAESSDEDQAQCLGILPAVAKKLTAHPQAPVPNMGWCQVRQNAQHELFDGIDDDAYFYFVHSFALAPGDFTLATADHAEPFTAVLAQDNFLATQFHPERSAAAGARLLSNFCSIGT